MEVRMEKNPKPMEGKMNERINETRKTLGKRIEVRHPKYKTIKNIV
jgi:hypothetical protein